MLRSELVAAIASAAAELNEQRERWLNPPEWIDPIAAAVDRTDDFADVPDVVPPLPGRERGGVRIEGSQPGAAVPQSPRALIRQSAIMARAAQHPQLKKRTLTNLYNERPTWLRLTHKRLDRAVLAAYAAVDPAGGWSPDWADVWEETGAGQPLPSQPGAAVPHHQESRPSQPGAAVPHHQESRQSQPGADVPHPLAARRAEIDQKVLANLLRLNQARSQ